MSLSDVIAIVGVAVAVVFGILAIVATYHIAVRTGVFQKPWVTFSVGLPTDEMSPDPTWAAVTGVSKFDCTYYIVGIPILLMNPERRGFKGGPVNKLWVQLEVPSRLFPEELGYVHSQLIDQYIKSSPCREKLFDPETVSSSSTKSNSCAKSRP